MLCRNRRFGIELTKQLGSVTIRESSKMTFHEELSEIAFCGVIEWLVEAERLDQPRKYDAEPLEMSVCVEGRIGFHGLLPMIPFFHNVKPLAALKCLSNFACAIAACCIGKVTAPGGFAAAHR